MKERFIKKHQQNKDYRVKKRSNDKQNNSITINNKYAVVIV